MIEWRVVPGFEGYEVSTIGTVRRRSTGRPRALNQNPAGYPTVTLWVNGRRATKRVHMLVAAAFLGPPEGREVRHRDDVKGNNAVGNLVYGTRSDNSRDRVRNGIHPMSNRTHCPRGHEYSESNTAFSSKGGRLCRECQRQHKREWARRNRSAVER